MRPQDVPDDRQVISDDLYREIILDHYRTPRRRGAVGGANLEAEGVNPLCGDEVRLTGIVEGGVLRRIGLEGKGCAISQASGSMMAEAVEGKDLRAIRGFVKAIKGMLLDGEDPESFPEELKSLESVRRYPVRIKCALLAWNTLLQALERYDGGGP